MGNFQHLLVAAVLFSALGLAVCSRQKVTALTFNTGLTGVVEIKNPGHETSREERRSAIIEAIRNENADIVCLQEIMIGIDIEAIVNSLQDVYPHSHSSLHLFNGKLPSQSAAPVVPPCPNQQMTDLLTCVVVNQCMDKLAAAFSVAAGFIDCVTANCLVEFQTVVLIGGEQCLTCIQNQIQNPTDIVPKCAPLTPTSPLGTMNTNGLLMLSKRAFTSRRAIDFYPNTPELFVRGYLEAKIDDLTAVCTHIFPYVAGPNPEPVMRTFFPTSIKQNAFEIGQLISEFGHVKPAVLMGDFNVHSRSTPADSGYDQFLRLRSVFNTDVSDDCSFCRPPENVYNVNDEPSNTVIDYVFGNGIRIFRTKRVFTPDTMSIRHKGQNLPLSDHFGIAGEFYFWRWIIYG